MKAAQLEYRPFAQPRRAAWQEFGDVIAEGLYSLVHLHLPVEQATAECTWEFPRSQRLSWRVWITRAADRPDIPEELTVSVGEAVKTLLTIRPELCEQYIRAWRDDMADWRRRLDGIATMPSIEAAMLKLRLVPGDVCQRQQENAAPPGGIPESRGRSSGHPVARHNAGDAGASRSNGDHRC